MIDPFEPTLLINENRNGGFKNKNNFKKDDDSDIDRLLNSDDDSPRFGKKAPVAKPSI